MQRFRSVAILLASILGLSPAAVAVAQPAAASGIRITRIVRGSVTGSPATPPTIRAVDFVDPSHGYLAAAGGAGYQGQGSANGNGLLATVNGGNTWTMVNTTSFEGLSFVGVKRGFGLTANGVLLTTASGGRHWQRVHTFAGLRHPSNDTLSFPDATHGWLGAGGILSRTVDGGKSWHSLPFRCFGAAFGGGIAGISFVNDHLGFLLCNSGNGPSRISLFRTKNGGNHWVPVSTVDSVSHIDGTLDFRSANLGFVTRGFGLLVRTVDGGRIFQSVLGVPFENVQGMSWLSVRTGYAFLPDALDKTVDGGRHWRQVYPNAQPQGAISFASARNGIGAATPWDQSAILVTHDGGVHWRQLNSLPNTAVSSFVRQPGGGLWAVATINDPRGRGNHVAILRAERGGAVWQTVKPLPEGSATLSFVTRRLGYLFDSFPAASGGYRNALYRSTNGGRSWTPVPVQQRVGNVVFTTPASAWGFEQGKAYLPRVAKHGFKKIPRRHVTVVVKTTDAGRSWHEVRTGLAGFIPGNLVFLNPRDGWLAGSQCQAPGACTSTLLRTIDGGSTWQMIRLGHFFIGGAPSGAGSLDPVSPLLAFIDGGVAIYQTRDGGVHWHVVR